MAIFLSANSQSSCPGFKTFTQGGWGSTPTGNNPGVYLQNNFAAAFPTGLTIGCNNKLRLTTATAVRNFLPQGGTATALPTGTLTNATKTNYANVFAGQLVALALNLRFDEYSANFAPSSTNLKNLLIASGPFMGWTVQQLFDQANLKIGGCAASNFTFSQYNTAVDNVNRNYDNGVIMGSFLVCPMTVTAAQINVDCYGGNTGSITVTPTGGLAPYTYTWSNGAGNVATATNLTAGTYTVTVNDAIGQTVTLSRTITQNTLIVATSTVNQNSCNHLNGELNSSISLSISGGIAPYSVSWNNGATGASIAGLAAGEYCYTVTDALGCSIEGCETITEPEVLVASISVAQRITCAGSCNAALTASAIGGTPDYTYSWNNGMNGNIIVSLCEGTYSVEVSDANGCTATSAEEMLDNPAPIALTGTVMTESTCDEGICDGTAQASIEGGEAPYSYLWSNGSDSNPIVLGLCEGEQVSLTVVDNRGCELNFLIGTITCRVDECSPLRTQTQGGWGAVPNGDNPGVYLHANFDAAFPSGLTIGCEENTLSFYSAQEITDFLPEGGTVSVLPTTSVLTGQLVAATLNNVFDAYDASFGAGSQSLGSMYTNAEGFEDMTIDEIIAEANLAIGGCSSAFSLPSLVAVLTAINENYDNGNQDNGDLSCTPGATLRSAREMEQAAFFVQVYPNPTDEVANLLITTNQEKNITISFFNMMGQLVLRETTAVNAGEQIISLPIHELPSNNYIVKVNDQVNESSYLLIVQ